MKPAKTMVKFVTVYALITCIFTSCTKSNLTEVDSLVQNAATVNKSFKFNPDSWLINTIAGSDTYGYSGDGGPAVNATLNNPANVYADKFGNVFITDLSNLVIRKIDRATGNISTIAGNGIAGFSGDGGPATSASINYAFHTTTDDQGNLYISDLVNNRIRKVDKRSGIIETIAGTGISGFNGDGNNALTTDLNLPMGIAFDKKGDLLFSDGTGLRLRKLNMKTKIITTIAGNGIRGYSGDDGPATQAMLNFIWNVTVDYETGEIYIGDEANFRIRKIDPKSGIISTVAGNGIEGNSGMGGIATKASFTKPVGIAIDKQGNLFISDEVLSQVYVVEKKSGHIFLIAGNGTNGFSGDGGPARNAILSHPNSLSLDPDGNLYINDGNNNRVRKLTATYNLN